MITQGEFIMIHELKKQGHSIRAIARITKIDRKTITKQLQKDKLHVIVRKSSKPSQLEPYKKYILDMISKTNSRISSDAVYREIIALGYSGKLRILQNFLNNEYDKRIKVDPIVRFETAPGYQAQVDWTTIRLGKNPIYAFVMTLGYSRVSFVYFTKNMEGKTFIDCHHKAFTYFGGVPKTILYDNMKTVIDKRDAYGKGKHRYFPELRDLSKVYGCAIKLCQPYRAKTKGKVERFKSYLKGNLYRPLVAKLSDSPVEITADLLNNYICSWLNHANNRIHGTTGQQPKNLCVEEVKYLNAYFTPIEPAKLKEFELGKKLTNVAIVPIKQPSLNIYDSLVV